MKYDFELDLVNNNSVLMILQQIKSNSVILEFGPANGRMTRYLKQNLGCEVYLVELDEESGKQALRYAKDLVVGDAENFEWYERYKNIRFDYIIFADVLEHLRNPEQVLLKSKLLLKESAEIILSVPNVAHNSVIINLLNNEFNYTDVGLLDNTHIHLFSKNSLERMIRDVGLHPIKRMATYSEVGTNEINNTTASVEGIDDSFWSTREYGEIYQFVYVLKTSINYVESNENYLSKILPRYYVQAFYGEEEYSEENSKRIYLQNFKGEQRFEFGVTPEESSIRLDPLNQSCVVRIKQISGYSGELPVDIKILSANAEIVDYDIYVFTTDDPIIIIQSENHTRLTKVIVDLEYITLNQNIVNHIAKYIINTINTRSLLVENNRKTVEKNRMYVENFNSLHREIEELRCKKVEIHQSMEEMSKQLIDQKNEYEQKFVKLQKEKEEYEQKLEEFNNQIESLTHILNKKDIEITKLHSHEGLWKKINKRIRR